MGITVSSLRANIYKIIDQVLETGVAVEIVRNGRRLKIVPEEKKSKLSRLKKRDIFNCDPEDIVQVSWESEWTEDGIS